MFGQDDSVNILNTLSYMILKLPCFSVDCTGGDVRRIWCVLYSVPRWLRIFPREAKKGESTCACGALPSSLTRSVLSVHIRGLPSRVEYDVVVYSVIFGT